MLLFILLFVKFNVSIDAIESMIVLFCRSELAIPCISIWFDHSLLVYIKSMFYKTLQLYAVWTLVNSIKQCHLWLHQVIFVLFYFTHCSLAVFRIRKWITVNVFLFCLISQLLVILYILYPFMLVFLISIKHFLSSFILTQLLKWLLMLLTIICFLWITPIYSVYNLLDFTVKLIILELFWVCKVPAHFEFIKLFVNTIFRNHGNS